MTAELSARPDLTAHARAMRLTPAAVVAGLRELVGARLVAYLGGVQETRAVRQWADGAREVQDPMVLRRLRLALQVAGLLVERDSPVVAQSWFQGMNPHLGDRAPARVLVEEDLDEAGPRVLAAARAFAANG